MKTKKALVIGNANYLVKPLTNPINDAKAMAEILSDKGFEVTKRFDLDSVKFFAAISEFCIAAGKNTDIVLFYFAGHGVEAGGVNYLIPNDFGDQSSLDYEAPTLDHIFKEFSKISSVEFRIYILDACRNDGAKQLLDLITNKNITSERPVHIGQTKPTIIEDNHFIAFATAPGMTASDSGTNGNNGLYTECLIEAISQYGMSIEDTFKLVREKVIARNGYKQIPWEHSSLRSYFSFDNYDVPRNLIDTKTLPFDMLLSSSISPDGQFMAYSGNSGRVVYENLDTSDADWISIADTNSNVQGEVVRLTEEFLLVGDSDGFLHRFGTKKQSTLKCRVFNSGFFAMSVAPDHKTVVVCGDGGILKQLCVNDLQLIDKVDTEIEIIHCTSHIPNRNDEVLICGGNHRLEVWNLINKSRVLALENEMFYTNVATFSSDGKFLATGHEEGVVKIWCTREFKLVQDIRLSENVENIVSVIEITKDGGEIPTNHILSLSFSSDSNLISIGTSDPSLVFYDIKYGQLIHQVKLDFSVAHVYSISQTLDDELLVCSGHKRKAYVFGTDKMIDAYKNKRLDQRWPRSFKPF